MKAATEIALKKAMQDSDDSSLVTLIFILHTRLQVQSRTLLKRMNVVSPSWRSSSRTAFGPVHQQKSPSFFCVRMPFSNCSSIRKRRRSSMRKRKRKKRKRRKEKKDKKGFCASCFFLLRGKDAVTASPKKNGLYLS